MVVNVIFLMLAAIVLIRTISYGFYCARRTAVGGISVFILAIGVIFCGAAVLITGIK